MTIVQTAGDPSRLSSRTVLGVIYAVWGYIIVGILRRLGPDPLVPRDPTPKLTRAPHL
jgi:hypothetical protein